MPLPLEAGIFQPMLSEFERAGVDLLLLQFSPLYEEMERFAAEVIPLVEQVQAGRRAPAPGGT